MGSPKAFRLAVDKTCQGARLPSIGIRLTHRLHLPAARETLS